VGRPGGPLLLRKTNWSPTSANGVAECRPRPAGGDQRYSPRVPTPKSVNRADCTPGTLFQPMRRQHKRWTPWWPPSSPS